MKTFQPNYQPTASVMDGSDREGFKQTLSASEMEFLRELLHSLRTLRYGSLSLTVHDGRLVEIQEVEKIRMNAGRKFD